MVHLYAFHDSYNYYSLGKALASPHATPSLIFQRWKWTCSIENLEVAFMGQD